MDFNNRRQHSCDSRMGHFSFQPTIPEYNEVIGANAGRPPPVSNAFFGILLQSAK